MDSKETEDLIEKIGFESSMILGNSEKWHHTVLQVMVPWLLRKKDKYYIKAFSQIWVKLAFLKKNDDGEKRNVVSETENGHWFGEKIEDFINAIANLNDTCGMVIVLTKVNVKQWLKY